MRSRSRSQGSKFWHAWKGLDPRHVYGKYKIGMGVMVNKLVGANANANANANTNANADANDWVTT